MRFLQLQYFSEVCRCGSISRAAKNLNVSQPAVSVAVSDLEKEFGATFFERRNRKLVLTKEGAEARKLADSLLSHYEIVAKKQKEMRNLLRPVRIGVSSMLGGAFIQQLIDPYTAETKMPMPQITEGPEQILKEMLHSHQADIAIVPFDETQEEGLNYMPVSRTSLCWCVGKDSPDAAKKKMPRRKLAGKKAVLRISYDTAYIASPYYQLRQDLQSAGILMRPVLYTNQYSTARALLTRGENIGAFFCRFQAEKDKEIVPIELDPPAEALIAAVWEPGAEKRSVVADFIQYLQAGSLQKGESI